MTLRIAWPPLVERAVHSIIVVALWMLLLLGGIYLLGLDAGAIIYGSSAFVVSLWVVNLEVERE